MIVIRISGKSSYLYSSLFLNGFRFFWKYTKLAETTASTRAPGTNPYIFVPLAHYECTPEGVRAASEDSLPFLREKLLFYHRQANYTFGDMPTPLMCELAANLAPLIFDFSAVVSPTQT